MGYSEVLSEGNYNFYRFLSKALMLLIFYYTYKYQDVEIFIL